MGRIIGIDYGGKRVGLAVTDPLQLIATPLGTVHSQEVVAFLKQYVAQEPVDAIVVGMPRTLLNEATDATGMVVGFVRKLQKEFPQLQVHTVDERFTSRMAFQSMIDAGLKKKDRQNKATIDKVSATIILQSYLESKTI